MSMAGQMVKRIGMEQLIEWLYENGYVVAKKVATPISVPPFTYEPVEEATVKKLIPGLVDRFE